jgi:hypothetical protein
MRFIHRIAFRPTQSQRRELASLGLKLPVGAAGIGGEGERHVGFDLAEDHENWAQIRRLLDAWGAYSWQYRTEFSPQEVAAADWLDVTAWHHGYPQPNSDFGYRTQTYDLSDWCEKCGVGKKQNASFRMKGEPKWRNNGALQLLWVYDELFVRPEVWTAVFEPHGVGCRSVDNRRGKPLSSVVQLRIEEAVPIDTTGLPFESCLDCGRKKYLPIARGPFPPLLRQPTGPSARTQQYFGSGGKAFSALFISRALARSLTQGQVRGVGLRPVADLVAGE